RRASRHLRPCAGDGRTAQFDVGQEARLAGRRLWRCRLDYAGNSRHDLKVFDAARNAIVVAPDRSAQRWQAAHGAETMSAPKRTLKTYVKMLRVHQWLKNSLIAVPTVLSHEYFNVGMIWQCVLAFVSFSAVASAIYIVNDFF